MPTTPLPQKKSLAKGIWPFGRQRVAVVRLDGVIGSGGTPGSLKRRLNLRSLNSTLERAFTMPRCDTVVLAINSPGGSPVQSALIAGRIRSLARENDKAVVAFVEDVAASGGYWLACAADEIFVNASSLIGSIGVISAGFGLVGLLEKLGVERRRYAAGDQKGMLDPFLPEDPAEVARLKTIQSEIHATFVAAVRERRGRRLTGDDAVLFTGDFWTGGRAVDLGLADGLGDLHAVMRERFGAKIKLVDVTAKRSLWPRRFGLGDWAPDISLGHDLLETVEDRAWWHRFGL